jgi:signal peptidase I
MRKLWGSIWEIAEVVLISFVTVFIIRQFIVQPFLVSGASMEPNFQSGNYLLIDELTYRFREPERGEVIVFEYPQDPSTYFIKRIIGLPGDRVLVKDNKVFVYRDGKPVELKEDYLPVEIRTSGKVDLKLGSDEYFVMGDNRYYSFDSRNWGAVQREEIIGLVRLRLFPITQAAYYSWGTE